MSRSNRSPLFGDSPPPPPPTLEHGRARAVSSSGVPPPHHLPFSRGGSVGQQRTEHDAFGASPSEARRVQPVHPRLQHPASSRHSADRPASAGEVQDQHPTGWGRGGGRPQFSDIGGSSRELNAGGRPGGRAYSASPEMCAGPHPDAFISSAHGGGGGRMLSRSVSHPLRDEPVAPRRETGSAPPMWDSSAVTRASWPRRAEDVPPVSVVGAGAAAVDWLGPEGIEAVVVRDRHRGRVGDGRAAYQPNQLLESVSTSKGDSSWRHRPQQQQQQQSQQQKMWEHGWGNDARGAGGYPGGRDPHAGESAMMQPKVSL